jgi:hypothetical protein
MIRQLGGQVDGSSLVCGCAVVSSYQGGVKLGDIVSWSTSSNMSVNSAAVNAGFETVGKVLALNSAKSIATVEWFGYNRLMELTYSGSVSRGNYVVNATAASSKVKASGSASASTAKAVVVAVDMPATGKLIVAAR